MGAFGWCVLRVGGQQWGRPGVGIVLGVAVVGSLWGSPKQVPDPGESDGLGGPMAGEALVEQPGGVVLAGSNEDLQDAWRQNAATMIRL